MIGAKFVPSQTTKSHGRPHDDLGIETRVLNRLASCGYPELARLSVRTENRTVTLEGRVCSYHLKQVAQTIVMSMEEVAGVCNIIDVVK